MDGTFSTHKISSELRRNTILYSSAKDETSFACEIWPSGYWNLFFDLRKDPFSTSQKNGGRNSIALSLILCGEFMAVCCRKHVTVLCKKNAEILVLNFL